jgi:hypothetical protein
MSRRIILVLALLIACKANQEENNRHGGKAAAGKQDCLKIVNGEHTDKYPSVGYLINNTGNACTGTWVGHNVMLAASHCLDPKDLKGILYVEGHEIDLNKLKSYTVSVPKKVLHNGHAGLGEAGTKDKNGELIDLSILIFPDHTAPQISEIFQGAVPYQNANATIVGYGRENLPGGKSEAQSKLQRKQVGHNDTVFSEKGFLDENLTLGPIEGVLTIIGNPNDNSTNQKQYGSLASSGDSGGPLFIGDKIAGVASFVVRDDKRESKDATSSGFTIYVNLSSKASKKLLDEAKSQGAAIGARSNRSGTAQSPQDPNGVPNASSSTAQPCAT